MKTLKRGSKGADVRRWQLFLIGQGFELGAIDGEFGAATQRASLSFQARHRLFADGVVGLKTVGMAMTLGFDNGLVKPAPTVATTAAALPVPDANWPPRPANLKPLTSTAARQKLFGAFKFAAAPISGNRENIQILGDWEERQIIRVEVPQLRGIAGAPSSGRGRVRFHRAAAPQLLALWRAWEEAGLLELVKTWDGSFVPRFVRGSRATLSNHCFGSAFDINASFNGLGTRPLLVGRVGSVRELVPLANKFGFFWGGHYNGRADGMHFEIARLD